MSNKNKNIQMITGDPKKAIVKLSIPMMISMLLIMLYNIADSIWVAGLGAECRGFVNLNEPKLTSLFSPAPAENEHFLRL